VRVTVLFSSLSKAPILNSSLVFLNFIGYSIFDLFSGGREASEVVVQHLQSQKYRSFINPDGPHGPSYQLKRGVLFMSSQANAPIIPVRFKCSHEIQLKWLFWDNKRVPLWRAQLQVEYGSPMVIPPNVDKLESEPYRMLLTRFLNGDDVAW
jgi:lysophospholipid acyltransferase (LPLAT)-like uncharacterized protein